MASTLTQRVSTIYIVDTGGLFFGHYSCLRLPHSLHFLNFHTFHASVICNFYSSRGNLFPVVDTFITDVSNFYFIALGIRPLHWSWWLVHLLCYFVWRFIFNFMDSTTVIFVVVLSTVLGQIRLPSLQDICLHCVSVDSSTVAYRPWLQALS